MVLVWKAYSVHCFDSKGNPAVFHTDHVFVLFTITKKGQFKACEEEHMTAVRWPEFCLGLSVWHCVRTEAGLAAGRPTQIYTNSANNSEAKQYVFDLSLETLARLQWDLSHLIICLNSQFSITTLAMRSESQLPNTRRDCDRPVATCPWM